MINQNGNEVPENKIVLVPTFQNEHLLSSDRINNIFTKIDKKRDWFTEHFYRCLPLAIGNKYGFILKSEYDVTFEWNGAQEKESVQIETYEDTSSLYPRMLSHFGSGIITIETPFILRTPPNINLMTINPPNYVLPGLTVMTGVVESDNLSHYFTFNIKINIPNTKITVPKGFPLAAVIPVPRYFIDNFELEIANNVFSEDIINNEIQAEEDFLILRNEVEPTMPNQVNRLYFKGIDVYGNKYKDHQGPR